MPEPKPYSSSTEAEKQLHTAYTSLLSGKRNTILLWGLSIITIGLLSLIIAEQILYLRAAAKTGILISLIILSGLYLKGLKAAPSQSFEDFYRKFSRKSGIPELKDTLDLEKRGKGHPALINAAIIQNLNRLDSSRLNQELREYRVASPVIKKYKTALLFTLLSAMVLTFTVYNFSEATERSLVFWNNFEKPNPYLYTVEPGHVTLEQGSNFQASVSFSGLRIPEEVSLQVRTSVEEDFRPVAVNQTESGYSSIPFELYDDLEYFIQMGEFRSEIYSAEVQLRPRFSELNALIVPPDYTLLDSTLYNYPFSQIRTYEGSEIHLTGTTNKKIRRLILNSSTGSDTLQVRTGQSFSYDLTLIQADTLTFSMADSSGLVNNTPFQIILTPQEDAYPIVEILEPGQSLEMVNPQQLDLLYRATDDFSLSSATFHYELKRAFVDKPEAEAFALNKPENGVAETFTWTLGDLDLKPRDVLSFWIKVQDNDAHNGFKASISQVLTLTVPSLVNYFEDLDKKENEVGSDLENVAESFEEMQDQYEQFKEQLKENPEQVGYEESQQLEQVRKQQEEVQKKIEELNQKFEEIKEEINENSVLSEETREAYEELQQLMQELDDPAFLEALEKMREQMSQFSPEQLREAMENLEFNEELYQERLKRTIELFKQLKLNSDLEKLVKSYEELARREKELQESMADEEQKTKQREQSLKENQTLKQNIDSLSQNATSKIKNALEKYQQDAKEKLDEISERLREELKDPGRRDQSEQAQEKQDKSKQSQSNQDGEQSSDQDQEKKDSKKQDQRSDKQDQGKEQQKQDQSRKNENQDQGEKQKENQDSGKKPIHQQYQQLAEMTQSLMSGMQQQQKQFNISGLKYVLNALLTLSTEQEDLTTLASSAESRSQAFIGYARDQRNVDEIFSALADSLFKLSAESPQFSNEINRKKLEVEKQLDRALEQMAERNRSQASIATRQALGGINEISFMLLNLLDQLQNSENGSGGGGMSMEQMIEQMQQSGEQQKQMNDMLQQMINDIQGEKLSMDQMERLNQIAKTQNRIRKQLQDLQQNGQAGDKIGSELERMIEQMEETINDLRGGNVDPTMIERQQNILSRMLEAEKALQERDEEEKREGRTAGEIERSTPPELTLEELEKQIRKRLNDPNYTKYSEDYQRLIEKYFELLRKTGIRL